MIVSDLNFLKSLFVHITLIIFMMTLNYMNFGKDINIEPKKSKKVYIKQAIRVDVVGMPKHSLKELRAMKLRLKSLKIKLLLLRLIKS